MRALARHGNDSSHARCFAQKSLQLEHIFGEVFRCHRVTSHGAHGDLIGAWGATEPEIDATWVNGGESSELFGNGERGMVRQHDPT